jgi:putative sigma-54 modulation protein
MRRIAKTDDDTCRTRRAVLRFHERKNVRFSGGAFRFVSHCHVPFIIRSENMNLQISGHHLDITPAIRDYVTGKLERITRHSDNLIDINVILSVEKLKHKAEITVHLSGKDIYVESAGEDMYAAIDILVDKLDRQVQKYKQKLKDHHRGEKIERSA